MKKLLIAVFDDHDKAARGIQKLLSEGIDRDDIAAIAKGEDTPEKSFELDKMNEHIGWWAKTGTVWGGIFGLLTGAFVSVIPGFGPIVAAGHIIPALAGAIGGAMVVGPAAALGAWMADFAVEEAQKLRYHDLLEEGKVLVAVKGDDESLQKARKALEGLAQEVKVH
ncbi:hypothetical protein [Hydrogenimonas sp.]